MAGGFAKIQNGFGPLHICPEWFHLTRPKGLSRNKLEALHNGAALLMSSAFSRHMCDQSD